MFCSEISTQPLRQLDWSTRTPWLLLTQKAEGATEKPHCSCTELPLRPKSRGPCSSCWLGRHRASHSNSVSVPIVTQWQLSPQKHKFWTSHWTDRSNRHSAFGCSSTSIRWYTFWGLPTRYSLLFAYRKVSNKSKARTGGVKYLDLRGTGSKGGIFPF